MEENKNNQEESTLDTQQNGYGADNITALEGLEAVRMRPGM